MLEYVKIYSDTEDWRLSMNDNDVAVNTLNTMLQRHARVVQGYEVEIANLTAEVFRLKAEIDSLKPRSDD